ncbi:hypothetical protein SNOG_09649 [Parastagonospora nodorum SN15]|uniref:Uncharacterized protein n=1 Tax=Phaeosphaeria nodorum (strain SN15 / ATCC MYA-4574 / FGSC 10173) TaxID=321614 RepID=Q0UF15_PHANO|nr:hypothetical protein SNOG_09649 [Parastagonospora nodorum SN15]EAT82914.1 hypothetical protein SNOG_09649 [Parastagonospora nodorum SN15]
MSRIRTHKFDPDPYQVYPYSSPNTSSRHLTGEGLLFTPRMDGSHDVLQGIFACMAAVLARS